jgi:type VI secretion system secreted protein Hcp
MAHSDMFLKITTTKQGLVKGESTDPKHLEEIVVIDWAWGAQAHTDMSGLGSTRKSSLGELDVTKRVDSASTPLMSALTHNESIKDAVLTVRKAGTDPLEYVTIKLEKARITRVHVKSEDHELIEKLTLAYQKITITYKPQTGTGTGGGSMVFEAQTAEV